MMCKLEKRDKRAKNTQSRRNDLAVCLTNVGLPSQLWSGLATVVI